MRSLRTFDAVGWFLLALVLTVGLTLVVTPSTAAPVARGTLEHDTAQVVSPPATRQVALGDYLAKNPRRIA